MEFRSLMQEATETFDEYYVRLRRMAVYCKFADENREVRSQIKTGCKLHKLRLLIMENTSENGMPLEEVLAKGRAMELAQKHSIELEANQLQKMSKLSGQKPSPDTRNLHHENIITLNSATSFVVLILMKEDVQLKEKVCTNCGKQNHFAKVCQGKVRDGRNTHLKSKFISWTLLLYTNCDTYARAHAHIHIHTHTHTHTHISHSIF